MFFVISLIIKKSINESISTTDWYPVSGSSKYQMIILTQTRSVLMKYNFFDQLSCPLVLGNDYKKTGDPDERLPSVSYCDLNENGLS